MTSATAIRVNRAPVLTLWAAVVAEQLGHPPDTASSLASIVAGTAAQAKARRLGIAEQREKTSREKREGAPVEQVVRLLGKDIRLVADADGVILAAGSDGKPAPAAPVRAYVARAFGDRLQEARQAMEKLAKTLPPDELNRVSFKLYEAFRPQVPEGAKGWGAKGELHLDRIRQASI
ncbi:hypothetical protein [Falsiroseomonas sp. HW251]|uniref:hypothetical protein n=1 Tax=Falsiroseomonas sp. HW251 TaxID=3390998 RepID=UPI003D311D02